MIYLDLFFSFLRVGCFAFGGAYGAIPLIRDTVLAHGWLTDEALAYMIAVSESTPGPIMINMATYVGSSQAGFFGAFLATLAVVIPSFVALILISGMLKTALKNHYVQAVLQGLKPCIIGIIFSTGLSMMLSNFISIENSSVSVHLSSSLIGVIVFAALWGFEICFKKKLSPIALILLSAFLGMIIYGV